MLVIMSFSYYYLILVHKKSSDVVSYMSQFSFILYARRRMCKIKGDSY